MWRLPTHPLRLYQPHISVFPPSRAAFHVAQPLQPHSVPNSAGDASSYRFIPPGAHLITVFLTADTTLDLIFSSAATSHNSDLLNTLLAHCIALFPTVASYSASHRTTGSHWNSHLGVAVTLCTCARGLDEFLCPKPVTDSAWQDLIPVGISGKFLSSYALILALTCSRPPKSTIVLDFTRSSVLDAATARSSFTILKIAYQHIPIVACCFPCAAMIAASLCFQLRRQCIILSVHVTWDAFNYSIPDCGYDSRPHFPIRHNLITPTSSTPSWPIILLYFLLRHHILIPCG
jgi:hypothetical protein